MKLAACYTVFNGTELLAKSIEQISNHVDHIIICYQYKSNKGNPSPSSMMSDIMKIKHKNRIHLVEFTPDLTLNTKENERRKHQLMIETASELDCTHFLLSACDHFYDENQFIHAKNECKVCNYDVTFTKMYTYYKYPTWQLTPIEAYCMPFICKIYSNTRIEKQNEYPERVDPSVQINTIKYRYTFTENDIMLHHYSMIREDIENKFTNAAASIRWKPDDIKLFIDEYNNYDININPGLKYFQGRKIIEVENKFNL